MRKLILVALLVFCISGAASAQNALPAFCGTLSEEHCTLLTQSQETMAALDSLSFDLDLNAAVANIPGMADPLTFNITGSGAYAGLDKARGDVALLEGDLANGLATLLSDISADLSITFNLPSELMQEIGADIPSSITIQERLVDGIGYLNLDTLRELIQDRSLRGWYGIDLANLLKTVLQQMPDIFNNPMMGNMSMMQDYQSIFGDPAFLNHFAKIEYVDIGMPDETTFRMTLDFGSLMSSPEIQSLMRQQMRAQGQAITEQEMNQAMAISSQMLKGMTFTIDETIGTDDHYLRGLHGTFVMDMSGMMTAMNEMSGSKNSTGMNAAPTVTVDFTVFYNRFNEVPEITAPENPTLIPYQSLIGALPSV